MSETTRATRIIVIAVLATAAVVTAVDLLAIARDPVAFVDGKILLPIIHDWWTGEDGLYRAVLEAEGEPGLAYYRYPPFWAFAMYPLAVSLPLRVGILAWGAICVAALGGGLAALLRNLGLHLVSVPVALVFLLMAWFGPVYESYYGPTSDLPMVGLMAVAFVFVERRRCSLAGLAFALAVVLKIYPVLFALYFLLRREHRMLAYSAAWYVVLHLVPMLFTGIRDTLDFYVTVLPISGGSSPSAENASLEMSLMAWQRLRWFRQGIGPLDPAAFPTVAAAVVRLAAVAAYAATFLTLQRRGRLENRRTRFLFYATWIALVMTLIPVSWVNYQLFLAFALVGAVVLLREPHREPRLAVAGAVVVLLAWVFMSTPFKSVAFSVAVSPELKRSDRLAQTVGYALDGELADRVALREQSLATADAEALRSLRGNEVRRRLHELGVPGTIATAPDCAIARERGAVRAKVACRTNGSIVRVIALRALVGVVVGVAMMIASIGASGVGVRSATRRDQGTTRP